MNYFNSASSDGLLGHLDVGHRDGLSRAINNVLSTEIALETYAQIIDGLPLSRVAWDRYKHKLHPKHPIDSHEDFCPGAIEEAEEMRKEFNIDLLKFDANLLQAYQSALLGTRQYQLRLLELTATALHGIAVYLFQKASCVHDLNYSLGSGLTIQEVTSWQRPRDEWLPVLPWPTLFTHPGFTAVERYPDGVGDLVGYWAEDRILGGVMLFDRSKAWDNEDEPNAYFQSSRPRRTYLVYQLLDEQQQELVDFIASPPENRTSTKCPLPLSSSPRNRVRVEPSDAIGVYEIYRDPWERAEREPNGIPRQLIRERDVISATDYPEVDEQLQRLLRRRD